MESAISRVNARMTGRVPMASFAEMAFATLKLSVPRSNPVQWAKTVSTVSAYSMGSAVLTNHVPMVWSVSNVHANP